MSMLGSEQPGEAEAARRKLLDHLGAHRLSLTDIAIRLRESAGRGSGESASFTHGAREMSLERQLGIARAAKLEAEGDARRAQMQAAELRQALQQAAFDVGRALQTEARARRLAWLGWVAAVLATCTAITLYQRLPDPGALEVRRVVAGTIAPLRAAPPAEDMEPVLRLSPGEHYGTVLVQDLAMRLGPNDDAGVRAFLNRGMRVVIEQQVRVGLQTWLLIRSVTGSGWVRSGDILH